MEPWICPWAKYGVPCTAKAPQRRFGPSRIAGCRGLITAIGVGGSLGVAGAVFQTLSRNVLGSPDIIGFTTGAATAAVVQIVFFGGGVLQTAGAAVLGGMLTALLVYALARKDGVSGGLRLVLVGIGVGAMLSAVMSFLVVRADIDDATVVQQWTAGSLTGRGWPHAVSVAIAVGVLVPALVVVSRRVTMMEMGDDAASSLGISVERYRFAGILLAVALTGAATAATGPIAFVALAAPQIARRLARRRRCSCRDFLPARRSSAGGRRLDRASGRGRSPHSGRSRHQSARWCLSDLAARSSGLKKTRYERDS